MLFHIKKLLFIYFLVSCNAQTLVHDIYDLNNQEELNEILNKNSFDDLSKKRTMIFIVDHIVKNGNSANVDEMVRFSFALESLNKICDKVDFSKDELLLLVDAINWSLVNESCMHANSILRMKLKIGPSDKDFIILGENQIKDLCVKWKLEINAKNEHKK